MIRTLSIVWLWIAGAVTMAAPLDPEAFPPPGEQVVVQGHRLHLYCTGRGTPSVILDSGLGGTVLDWQRVQPHIAPTTRVCSYDRPGYGWSERVGNRTHTIDWLTDALHHLLQQGGVTPPYVLVGHSFGGLIAQLYAKRHPERIVGLVLVDSTHPAQFERFVAAGVKRRLVPSNNGQFVIGNHYRIPDGLPEGWKATARALAVTPDAVGSLYSEMRHLQTNAQWVGHFDGRLPDVPMVVLVHDSRLRATDPQRQRMAETWMLLQRELTEEVSLGKLVIAERSGHYIHLDQPELVVDAILEVIMQARQP